MDSMIQFRGMRRFVAYNALLTATSMAALVIHLFIISLYLAFLSIQLILIISETLLN